MLSDGRVESVGTNQRDVIYIEIVRFCRYYLFTKVILRRIKCHTNSFVKE